MEWILWFFLFWKWSPGCSANHMNRQGRPTNSISAYYPVHASEISWLTWNGCRLHKMNRLHGQIKNESNAKNVNATFVHITMDTMQRYMQRQLATLITTIIIRSRLANSLVTYSFNWVFTVDGSQTSMTVDKPDSPLPPDFSPCAMCFEAIVCTLYGHRRPVLARIIIEVFWNRLQDARMRRI